jgi:hypothetical protein
MLRDVWVMCALLGLFIVVFGVRSVCCMMLGCICIVGFIYYNFLSKEVDQLKNLWVD